MIADSRVVAFESLHGFRVRAGLIGALFAAICRLADDAGLRDRTTKLNLDTGT